MQKVKNGDTIAVHYEGRLINGKTFDSSAGKDPLRFKVGSGTVIKGFEEALINMEVGDRKTVQIATDDAYGPVREEMVMEYPVLQLPENVQPEIGQQYQMGDEQGNIFRVMVAAITEEFVTLDANHPLAGQDLIFDIELMEIFA